MLMKQVLVMSAIIAGILFAVVIPVQGNQEKIAGKKEAEIDSGQIARWIEQLSDDDYKTRKIAANDLFKAGKPAIPSVAKAAETKDLEISTQCISILSRHLFSNDDTNKEAARTELKKLSQSEDAAVAQRAKALLPPEMNQPAGANPQAQIIQLRNGNIRIRVAGPNGIQIQGGQGGAVPVPFPGGVFPGFPNAGNNGQPREVTTRDDGRTVKLTENPDGSVVVKITKKVNGEPETKEYKAGSAEELKQKHPEVHKLYEKHMPAPENNARNVRGVFPGPNGIQVRGFPRGIMPPVLPPQLQPRARGEEVTARDGNRKINIKRFPDGKLIVKVTEVEKGVKTTREYEGKNDGDLKKKHPDIYKLYKKHMPVKQANAGNALPPGIGVPQIIINGQLFPPPNFPQPGNVQGNVTSKSTTIINGERTMKVHQNGETIVIKDSNGNDIHVTVTRQENGNEVTKEYKAKDLEELKKKHPEGAKIYEEHTNDSQMQEFPRAIHRPVLPQRFLPKVRPNNAKPKDVI